MSRFLVFLGLVALSAFIFGASVTAKHEEVAERAGIPTPLSILGQAFKWAAKHCLDEAIANCHGDFDWKHPQKFLKCGGKFLEDNRERCIANE